MKFNLLRFCLTGILFISLVGCKQRQTVLVYFENDVHCAMDAYVDIAAMRDSALLKTPYVAVVSSGDFFQGDIIGSLSQGQYIVDVMNTVPYDVVTLGNHEFDYGIARQKQLCDELTADVVCCNITRLQEDGGTMLYPPYVIRKYGPVSVAFVGVATPSTLHTSTPTYFMDSAGHVIYDFHQTNSFQCVQQAVDDARKHGADYVIVLSHLGDDTPPDCSPNLIAATKGIDAVLDGHAHHVLHQRLPNADGEYVWLASVGSKGKYVGELTIPVKGDIAVRLIDPVTIDDNALPQRVTDKIADIENRLDSLVNKPVGYSQVNLLDRDSHQTRIIRWQETNLSDFAADAMRVVGGGQVGVMHAGGLRAPIDTGVITLGEIISLFPFNNRLAKVSMTGQQLLDAMEVSVASYPIESGDFHICSGLRYCIDPDIPSSVIWDETKMFVGVGDTRRIVRMEVMSNDGRWQLIDPDATYTVSGLNYTLLSGGASGMFRYAQPLPAEDIKDTDILLRYLQHLNDTIRFSQYPEDLHEHRFEVL